MAVVTERKRPHFFAGYCAIVDEDWDDLFVPQLIASTCYEQFEGGGRNNFGCAINEWRSDRTARPASTAIYVTGRIRAVGCSARDLGMRLDTVAAARFS
jgi:hypothetical protein